MKKILIFLFLFIIPFSVSAYNKKNVKLDKCVDGDTAWFILNGEEIKVRFIGIDSPELESSNKKGEPYSKEAARYTCRKLKNADKITIEFDSIAGEKDIYDRYLAYVLVDGKLLNKNIVKNGYAKVKYINKKYKYYDDLFLAEEYAKINKKGIYSDREITEEIDYKNIQKIIKKYTKKLISNILKNF